MISRLLKKTSVLVLLSIAAMTLAPIVSYAATVMEFIYRPASADVYFSQNELSGYIYTKDPNGVSVRANNGNGSVTQVTYRSAFLSERLYDDSNNPYYKFDYLFEDDIMTQAPSSLSVDLGGSTYTLNGVQHSPEYPDVYEYFSTLSADLGTYRMPGELLMPSAMAATYMLPAGSELFKFSPSKIGNDANVINVLLPYDYQTKIIADSTVLEDFEITDLSVTESVYSKRLSFSSGGGLEFVLNTPLVQGHEYLVKLSSSSSGDEITLPKKEGVYTTKVDVGHWSGTFPSGWSVEDNSVYFRNIVIGNPVIEPPADPTDPKDPTDPTDPTDPYVPGPSTPPSNPDVEIVNEESLKNGAKDKVAVDIAGGKKQVLLPAKAADIVGDRKLELNGDKFDVEIPQGVLKKLLDMVPADQASGAQISFSMNQVSEAELARLLNGSKQDDRLQLKSAGEVFDFKLSIVTADGKEVTLSQFDQPLTLRFKVPSDVNLSLLGVYYISDDGKLEYVGGELIDGDLVADVSHFSTYAALEYNKSFDDIPADYWASDVIKELAAKQIVTGASDRTYEPLKQMTRAEFATLIARTLHLTATKAATFEDVKSGNVHADAIAAAYEAGIIAGRNASTFAPDDLITREEMAAMIVRAYEYKKGHKTDPASASAYSDRQLAAAWALPYIDTATEIGFVKGNGKATFAPKQFMTRAEGAQVIYLLLKSN